MPTYNDFIEKKNNKITEEITKPKFKAKGYRPWNNEMKENNIESENNTSGSSTGNDDNLSPNYTTFIKQDNDKISLTQFEITESKLNKLYGVQKNILEFLISKVKNHDNKNITNPLNISDISSHCSISTTIVDTALQRLKSKNILKTYDYKTGIGGYSRYIINSEIYNLYKKIA